MKPAVFTVLETGDTIPLEQRHESVELKLKALEGLIERNEPALLFIQEIEEDLDRMDEDEEETLRSKFYFEQLLKRWGEKQPEEGKPTTQARIIPTTQCRRVTLIMGLLFLFAVLLYLVLHFLG